MKYLANSNVEDRKVPKLFQYILQKYHAEDYEEAVDCFKNSFKKCLQNYDDRDRRLNSASKKVLSSEDAVFKSNPAKAVFEKRKNGVSPSVIYRPPPAFL